MLLYYFGQGIILCNRKVNTKLNLSDLYLDYGTGRLMDCVSVTIYPKYRCNYPIQIVIHIDV